MSPKMMRKAKGSFLPLLPLLLLGLAFMWVGTFTPANLRAGDNLDMQPAEGGPIYDLRWDPRLFDPSGFIEWFHNPSLIPIIGVCTSLPTTPHLVVGRSACRIGVGPSLNRSWAQRSRPVVQAGRRAFPGDESVVD